MIVHVAIALMLSGSTPAPAPADHLPIVVTLAEDGSSSLRDAGGSAAPAATVDDAPAQRSHPRRVRRRGTRRLPAAPSARTPRTPAIGASPVVAPAHTEEATTAESAVAGAASTDTGDGAPGTAPGTAHGARGSGSGSDGVGGGATAIQSGPRLLATANPCAGYFPVGSHASHGQARVYIEVGPDGRPALARTLRASPEGQGFGAAARACARRLRFTPARTRSGEAVTATAQVVLSFDRG